MRSTLEMLWLTTAVAVVATLSIVLHGPAPAAAGDRAAVCRTVSTTAGATITACEMTAVGRWPLAVGR